jgi:hypothetical protein
MMASAIYASQFRDDMETMLAELFPQAVIAPTKEPAVPMQAGKLYLVLGTPHASLSSTSGGVASARMNGHIILHYEGVKRDDAEDILTDAAEALAQFLARAADSHPLAVNKWAAVKDITVGSLPQPGRSGRHGLMRSLVVRFTVHFLYPSL